MLGYHYGLKQYSHNPYLGFLLGLFQPFFLPENNRLSSIEKPVFKGGFNKKLAETA